jgi:hypothetical protein
MNKYTYILFLLVAVAFVACKSGNDKSEEISDGIEIIDKDSLDPMLVEDTTKKSHEIKEHQENLKVIEKKFGEQWGFCECVVANDSIDKAVKKLVDFESKQAEKLLERFEYVSTKCQAFLGMDANRTPEERIKHEKRVKKCLKNAKVKK